VSLRKLPILMLAVLGPACQDPVDAAAKARIFSPEDPPLAISAAAQSLPPDRIDSDPRVAHRILRMDAAEVVERLGPHVVTTKVSFEWTGADAPIRLDETRTIVAGRGGVGGDFSVVMENSRDQGFEVLRKDDKVYARNRYGKFRQRLRDRGMAERVRSEVQGVIRDVDELFHSRLALTPQGSTTVDGRSALKFAVSLAAEAPRLEAGVTLPDPIEPKGGRDAQTRRRMRFHEERVPVSLQGELVVDAETSVVLQAKFDGKVRVPKGDQQASSELKLQVRTGLTGIGRDPALKVPEDFLPDADKPAGIADVLDRFGIPRGEAAPQDGEAAPKPVTQDE